MITVEAATCHLHAFQVSVTWLLRRGQWRTPLPSSLSFACSICVCVLPVCRHQLGMANASANPPVCNSQRERQQLGRNLAVIWPLQGKRLGVRDHIPGIGLFPALMQ